MRWRRCMLVILISQEAQPVRGSLCVSCKSRDAVIYRRPDDVQADAVVSVAQPIAQSTNINPGMPGHQCLGCVPQAKCRLADAFQTALDCIAGSAISLEGTLSHALHISGYTRGLIPQDVDRIVPFRRQAGGPARYCGAAQPLRSVQGPD